MDHEYYMHRALELAREAAAAGEVPVGCVIVRGGEIVGEGRNRREEKQATSSHAEMEAIAMANAHLGSWRLVDCALYVTLEPCPMCAGAIINSRVRRVIYGASDPKAGSCGTLANLFEIPYNHKPEVVSGVLEEECSAILSEFFAKLREKRKQKKEDPSG